MKIRRVEWKRVPTIFESADILITRGMLIAALAHEPRDKDGNKSVIWLRWWIKRGKYLSDIH